jgi:hypothetical protein
MTAPPVYDSIGTTYNTTRRADPRIEQVIWSALAAMAILTVHHWSDYRAGLRELRRVARRRVLVVYWDQEVVDRLWLADCFPEAFAFDRRRGPSLAEVPAALGLDTNVVPLLVPHDCRDGDSGAAGTLALCLTRRDLTSSAGGVILVIAERRTGGCWPAWRRRCSSPAVSPFTWSLAIPPPCRHANLRPRRHR